MIKYSIFINSVVAGKEILVARFPNSSSEN